jgi:hypothetical protein
MVVILGCLSKKASICAALDKSKSALVAPIASGINERTADPNLPAAPVVKIELLIR